MASTTSLSGQHVLQQAKRWLFPRPGEADTYAVVDTQFTTGEPIDPTARDELGRTVGKRSRP